MHWLWSIHRISPLSIFKVIIIIFIIINIVVVIILIIIIFVVLIVIIVSSIAFLRSLIALEGRTQDPVMPSLVLQGLNTYQAFWSWSWWWWWWCWWWWWWWWIIDIDINGCLSTVSIQRHSLLVNPIHLSFCVHTNKLSGAYKCSPIQKFVWDSRMTVLHKLLDVWTYVWHVMQYIWKYSCQLFHPP